MARPEPAGLRVAELVVDYGQARALAGVDIEVRPGEIVAIIGANGAGKTTLLRSISGVVRARSGAIHFAGQDITRAPPHRIAAAGLLHVPEGRMILKRMSVRDNLLAGAAARRSRAKLSEDIEALLVQFPALRPRLHDHAGVLSGGQQQMLALARALIGQPRLLMLDEPSLGLAPLVVEEIFAIIEALRARGNTILLVEQNARKALRIADRAYVLALGTVLMAGPSADVVADPQVIDVYLGS